MKKWRTILLISFFSLAYLGLLFNLYRLQIEKNKEYVVKAGNQTAARGTLEARRGSISFLDKNGTLIPAALNKEYSLIYAVPKEVKNHKTASISLASTLGIDESEVAAKLSKKQDQYEEIYFKATNEQVNLVKDLKIEGIYVKEKLSRFYPFRNLSSHVLGFVSPASERETKDGEYKEKGRYGLETFFEKQLSGITGTTQGERVVFPEDGEGLVLTIDRNIQTQSEEILKRLVEKWGAVSGTVVVQEPFSGKILAMGSYPNFDPNNYKEYDLKIFMNPAVQLLYEPGSVFKPITMAAGIDSGKITPDTTYVDMGSVTLNTWTIKNWDQKAHGRQSMTGVIENSINTGTVFAEQQMGHKIFKGYLEKFGFNDLTKISLPGEVKSNLGALKNGKDVNYATASFGQGVSVTPVSLVNAFSAVANGGNLMKPIILSKEQPEVVRRVVSEDTARKVTNMMVSAVKVNRLADIPNYTVAGKTGTAFIPDFVRGGYTEDVINTYIGFAPASDPKFVILIKIEKPKNAPLAGQTVVPAFRELAQFILNYYNIAPDIAKKQN